MSLWQRYIENYFKRFASPERIIESPLDTSCQMIIVIPCHNEPDLLGTLNSLLDCQPPPYTIEVIVVINHGVNASDAIITANKKSSSDFEQWNRNVKSTNNNLIFHVIEAFDLPAKTAGVGLARKTGMDEALRRFVSIDLDGAIVCLDADCKVSKNYLVAIDQQFVKTKAGLGEVYFEHPFENEKDEKLKSGIINYELFLHYYVEGLKESGFPYAIQTIGSCMLVKASTYAKHGGMNKRKAGEDFYFLHKIIPHEQFVGVNEATVYPSCRTSDRVPFGTGKAQQDWVDQETSDFLTYDPKVFEALGNLIDVVPSFYHSEDTDKVINKLDEIPRSFLNLSDYRSKIQLIKLNCKSIEQFEKQFFIWFDGFMCMKFVHFVRDRYYPNIPIMAAVQSLIDQTGNLIELLHAMRMHSKSLLKQ